MLHCELHVGCRWATSLNVVTSVVQLDSNVVCFNVRSAVVVEVEGAGSPMRLHVFVVRGRRGSADTASQAAETIRRWCSSTRSYLCPRCSTGTTRSSAASSSSSTRRWLTLALAPTLTLVLPLILTLTLTLTLTPTQTLPLGLTLTLSLLTLTLRSRCATITLGVSVMR